MLFNDINIYKWLQELIRMKFDVGQIDKTNGISYHEINANSVSFLIHRRQK